MTIVVNGRFLGQPLTGVQRFAAECLRALHEEMSARDGTPPIVRQPSRALASGPVGYLWEQVVLAWHGRGAIVLSLANLGPLALRRQVVVLHGAAIYDVPASYRRAYRFAHRLVHRGMVRRGAKLATVSEFSRERLSAVLGVAPDEITVTGAGCDHVDRVVPNPSVLDRLGLRPNTYVLAVASRTAWRHTVALPPRTGSCDTTSPRHVSRTEATAYSPPNQPHPPLLCLADRPSTCRPRRRRRLFFRLPRPS